MLAQPRNIIQHVACFLATVGVCLATLGWLSAYDGAAVPVWPGSGLVLALVWLCGAQVSVAIALGVALALVAAGKTELVPLVVTTNMLGGLAGAHVLRVIGFDPSLRRLRDVWTMLIVVATVAPLISGSATLVVQLASANPWALYAARGTLVADVLGSLLVAPVVLIWSAILRDLRERPSRTRALEAVALAAFLVVSSLIAYGMLGALPVQRVYLIVPALFWAALRFGPGGGVLAMAVSTSILTWLTVHGLGVYAADPSDIDLPKVQTFGMVVGFVLPVIAATSSNGKRASEEAGRLRAEARFGKLMEHISDMVLVVDAQGRLSYCNAAVPRVLGHTPETLDALVHAEDVGELQRNLDIAGQSGTDLAALSFRILHADGSSLPVEAVATNGLLDPHTGGWVLNLRDVTERVRAEAELRYQAFHDALTGLPNRTLFADRLAHALTRAERRGVLTAVVFLDLDNFKHINDSLGHEAGDRLLCEVADRLKARLRPGDTVARLGGDEFTVLVEDLTHRSEADDVAERVAGALREPFTLGVREVAVSGSVGIALGSAGDTPGDLLRKADIAMYAAKASGKARQVGFEPEMEHAVRLRLELETNLRHAIQNDELVLHYQPLIDFATGEVRAVEALVRWQHPAHGLVPPDRFIPLAEETGLIVPLGAWVLETACRQVRAWQRETVVAEELRLSVNLAVPQLQEPEFVDTVRAILQRTDFDPRLLQLEITERVAVDDSPRTHAALSELAELGIGISIDDFGAGNSALGYLTRFPVTNLKIDRSFIAGLGSDLRSEAVVRGVVALARALELTVTGEGIETAEQFGQLRQMGCHHAQGYYLGSPVPAERLFEAKAPLAA